MTRRADLIDVAMGREPAEKIIRGGKLVDVYTGEIYEAGIAIKGSRIAAVGDISYTVGPDTEIVDASGKYLTPGFIDTHQHSYEAHLNMTEYARVLIPNGTTAVSEAFYGMGIVRGEKAIRFFLEELKKTPLKVIFLVPTLAYLQNRELGVVESPYSITAQQMLEMLEWPECRGIEEPPYIPIAEKDPLFLELFQRTIDKGYAITGHACGANQKQLNAYAVMGAGSDHECVNEWEARERARLGIRVSMREGSGASDVVNVSRALSELKLDSRHFNFCGDEVEFLRLLRQGHLNYNIRLAVSSGVNPVTAIQMATINAAQFFRMDHELGSLTPGKIADILILSDLREFNVEKVFADGKLVAKDGSFIGEMERPEYPAFLYNTVELKRPVTAEDFRIKAPQGKNQVKVRVIGLTDGSLFSDCRMAILDVKDGNVIPDLEQDILKISMVDRYNRFAGAASSFIQGFNLKAGAIGSTYNPVYENIVVVGTNDQDMALAANKLAELGGGFIAVKDGQVLAQLEMPLVSLLSDASLEEATQKMDRVYAAVRGLGCKLKKGPYHSLAFMCICGEIGDFKIGHNGLFDVRQARFIPTIID